ncbi:hypothetical protein A2331_05955 [Candidatus Falkowbacteria bacterium RIFOXYB2_FULL_34_18]|uniref:Tetratricopeptide repeat-like domain-containing protein n=1 Tax=Candidatus Falkowbacteria bacterium RIFOXYD2_FULL_34_120 TaxID=1798007 RepID=A0A1F5TP77_9BACT|nr:MAG: hypothetical protein A2331_05955 [Candidatus Falkowbacteria bacterium RIFOXYB2_FULL_34_18]OGF29068.1 MAG: hypothetical protein A2500_03440 [Candidatus Falkowbacteria bacterium RIFOXYC12_FULL_34_55]OGF36122.1 MAG: hypothetical protein A2466_03530 [Candidatus Falkowbacteria bacterium RIFOXYC2_FULL_34_220]OGF38574.1 MAG: hypothetical protein A2515_04790 [Candidatus Falkowbacteria bacterium RIFOXYD12_FULL_34_57]OGF40753.1 MAG: hypothetical protein A2531_06965 [Candidatus Falkowbacteria bact
MNQEINKGRKTMQFLKNIYFTVITMLFGAYILIKGIFRGLDVHKALKLHEQGKLDDALKKYEKFFKIFKKFDKKDKHLSQPNDILGAYYFNAALIYKIKNNIYQANQYFANARKLGITENPDEWNAAKPLIIKGKG